MIAHELTHVTQQHENGVIQSKLEIGHQGNSFEKEADQAAEQIILGRYPLSEQSKKSSCSSFGNDPYISKEGRNELWKIRRTGIKGRRVRKS